MHTSTPCSLESQLTVTVIKFSMCLIKHEHMHINPLLLKPLIKGLIIIMLSSHGINEPLYIAMDKRFFYQTDFKKL